MLLRIRVRLPDRPGSLGQVARTLGAAGADVVQMAVLERDNGRAMDDFTVVWPAGAGTDRLAEGLGSVPGVEVVGIWPTAEPQGAFPDAAVIGQVAAVPEHGARILADAVPAILSADWAGLAELEGEGGAVLVHVSAGRHFRRPACRGCCRCGRARSPRRTARGTRSARSPRAASRWSSPGRAPRRSTGRRCSGWSSSPVRRTRSSTRTGRSSDLVVTTVPI
ncbi:ACT domain-containing protein [Actinomadura madurae]|uniref:ACT domain-containing protein n=1 Tax=Actinomadura madurae TaxID=1993 RepID=UPI0035592154